MPKPRRSRAVRPPARAAALPRHGGLAVPWITGWFDGRPYFGVNFPLRRIQCIKYRLCQFCREPLGRRIGLIVRPADIAVGYVDEPAMHPECHDYAVAVCPMLNGSLDHYRAAPPAAVAGLIAVQASRAGKPAEAYEAWYITPSGYEIAYGPDGAVLGIRLDVPVLMKRPVRAAARPRLTDEHAALLRQVLALESSLEGPATS
ncbi:cell envelope biogenesis protein OmpA [Streptomyces sp. NPDC094468]|uniref:cell envelope biogenesis protein OmpA n=1 Tax=Streptomyces sp. NPDC094468 TaxID=3366066 RepID=UPI003800DAE0